MDTLSLENTQVPDRVSILYGAICEYGARADAGECVKFYEALDEIAKHARLGAAVEAMPTNRATTKAINDLGVWTGKWLLLHYINHKWFADNVVSSEDLATDSY